MEPTGSIASTVTGSTNNPSIKVLDFSAPQAAETLLARILASALTDGPALAEATMSVLRTLASKATGQLEPIPVGQGRN